MLLQLLLDTFAPIRLVLTIETPLDAVAAAWFDPIALYGTNSQGAGT